MIKEGIRLAEVRRPDFKQLMRDDPRQALETSVPRVVRQQLPTEILTLLEKPKNARGVLRVYQGVPKPGEPLPASSLTHRIAEFPDGKAYNAYVYGRHKEKVTWTPGAALNGVTLDSDFAVNEDPARVLETGELPDPTKSTVNVCPVSGKSSASPEASVVPISAEVTAVETPEEIVFLCSSTHWPQYKETLLMAEGGAGGPTQFTGILPSTPTPSLGTIKVLFIPMAFADQNVVPMTEGRAADNLRDMADFYSKSSYGRLTTLYTVTPPVVLPHNEAWYNQRDTSNGGDIDGVGMEHAHARDAARKLGFDSNDYDCVVVRLNGGPRTAGGLGGGASVWLWADDVGTMAHEVGHCFGLSHANFWDTAGTSAIGAGANQEYGDIFDIMGGSPFPKGQYNAQGKNQIRWLPSNYVQNVNQSGLYRLYAFDQPALDPALRYALTITKDSQRTYWGELRTLFDAINPWAANGMVLGWRYPSAGGGNIHLLDTTPGSPFGKEDAPISLGRTFSDTEADLHITCVAVNNNTTPKSADMVVNFGPFPGNRPPTLALSASSIVVPTGATVTFTATANDPDGDTLAYAWQNFGDTSVKIVSPNSPVITRTFSSPGCYVVSCTVSDMKGGSAQRTQLITVGDGGGRFNISGRITAQGTGLANVAVTASGGGGTYNGISDNDGYFTIPNLTASTYSVTPLLYGYLFSELFNNSIAVGPSYQGANFDAETTPRVSLSAPVATANEATPSPGTFRITRTGDTSAALTVNVNSALGTAAKTADFTFSPDYVAGSQGFSTFTVPAGQASLDISVTPVTDTLAEGVETVLLQVGPGNGYVVSSNSSANVAILDDDSVLPKVSVRSMVTSTLENSGQAVPVTFSRTGSTAASMVVNYTLTGTATNTTDYTTLGGTITIPAGAASAVVNVTPVDDSLSEPLETVKLNVTANAAYLVESTLSSVTVNLVDNDVQILNVTATDPSATEVNLSVAGAVPDTGTFVVTRAGDFTNPLTVYYSVAGVNSGTAALHGVDYEALPGVLLIPAGASSAAVTILPRYDTLGEGVENVVFELGAGPTNYRIGPNAVATVTIADGSANLPLVDVIQMANAAEPSTNGVFRVTGRGAGTGNVTVKYTVSGTAVAGTDYTITGLDNATLAGTTTLTLNNGAVVNKDLIVTVINDAAVEALKTLTLTITPDAAYQTYDPTRIARMWIRDDEQPTVFVDAQVGTSSGSNGPPTVSENDAASTKKFYLSRTGSTAAALTVNYTLSGTATSGADYTALSGTATIPAGSPGVLVPFTLLDDSANEGTETLIFSLAAGNYSRGPDTTIFITDNEVSPTLISFPTPNASAGSESVASPVIPVTLNAAAAVPVKVEYYVDSGSRAISTFTPTYQHVLPYWVRVVRTGNAFASFESSDGINWVQRGSTATLTMSSINYLAGIAVTSGQAGTPLTATLDNLTVTGLDAGGTAGSITGADVGTVSPAGTHPLNAGVYTVTAGGAGINWNNTSDNFHYVYCPITNSLNCTITARVLTESAATTAPRAGVMIRESTVNNASFAASLAIRAAAAGQNEFYQMYRTATAGGNAVKSYNFTSVLKLNRPQWLRLQRAADVFSAFTSPDGVTWSALGTPQTLPIGAPVMAGLAVSAKSDGLLSTATFDNVTLTGNPLLEGRTIGFVNEQGSESLSGGVWTVTGSGAQIGSDQDECHFVGAPVTGNFTLTARLLSQAGGATSAQAGIMIREGTGRMARMIYNGYTLNDTFELLWRDSTVTNAFGAGVDYLMPTGVLTFAPGETTKNLPLSILNDTLNEDNETLTLKLRNPVGASLGAQSRYTYLIQDDDSPTALVYVGFAAPTSSVLESSGSAPIQVALSVPAPTAISVNYAVTGGTAGASDYTLAAGTLNFAAGQSVATISASLLNDAIVEVPETVIVTLSNPVGAKLGSLNTHNLTINDDDVPVVTLAANDPDAAESGGDGQFTVTRTGPTSAALTANLTWSGTATSGSDFTALPASVTIAAGQANALISVTPQQDIANEGSETVIGTLNADAAYNIGTANTATVTLTDDDRSTVSIVANDSAASETPGNPGQFTITRTAPTTGTLSVPLTITGTATNTTDYATLSTTLNFAANESSRTLNVTPVDDGSTEGTEVVTVQVGNGSYAVGGNGYASVTLADNDSPPTLFVDRPTVQGTLIASGNGVMVTASVSDDGSPQPVALTWSQLSGPGTATFAAPTSATSAVTFSANGTYVLKISATDGQFTVSDQVTVVVGSAISASEWIVQDMGPSVSQRGQSAAKNGIYQLTGMGTGYASTSNDMAHVMVRPVSGDTTVVTRLLSVSGPATAPLAGVTIRNSLARGARRAVLGYVPGVGLQFRTRTSSSTNDTVVTQAGVTLPVWLKLQRNSTTGEITASYAANVSNAPGTWTTIGTPVNVPIDNNADIGLTVTSNHTTALSSAAFDQLTPLPTGPAVLAEDCGTSNPIAGTFSESNGTFTVGGSGSMDGGGAFYGQQYQGDLMATAKMTDATSGASYAKSGLMIRESMDNNGGYAFVGRIPVGSYSSFNWRSFAGGSTGGVPAFTGKVRWMRLIRQGNSITAFHAADVSGAPGAWAQLGQPRTVIMSTPVLVGFAVDNGGGVGLNTATFSNLSIVPLNKAPIVDPGTVASSVVTSTPLAGTVSDDNFPSPPNLTTQWSKLSGPGGVTFGNASAPNTVANFTADGTYTLRLSASDDSVETFCDLSISAYTSAFRQWQGAHFNGGNSNPAAAPATDPDADGLPNFLEYCLDTDPNVSTPNPIVRETTTVGADRFLRLKIPKNPGATGVTYEVLATSDLSNSSSWSSSGLIIEQNSNTFLQVRDYIPMNGSRSRFMRLKVSQ